MKTHLNLPHIIALLRFASFARSTTHSLVVMSPLSHIALLALLYVVASAPKSAAVPMTLRARVPAKLNAGAASLPAASPASPSPFNAPLVDCSKYEPVPGCSMTANCLKLSCQETIPVIHEEIGLVLDLEPCGRPYPTVNLTVFANGLPPFATFVQGTADIPIPGISVAGVGVDIKITAGPLENHELPLTLILETCVPIWGCTEILTILDGESIPVDIDCDLARSNKIVH